MPKARALTRSRTRNFGGKGSLALPVGTMVPSVLGGDGGEIGRGVLIPNNLGLVAEKLGRWTKLFFARHFAHKLSLAGVCNPA